MASRRAWERTDSSSSVLTDDFLRCQACDGDFNGPKMLPCLHSFCYDCLSTSLGRNKIGPGQAFLCPLCKMRCTVPAGGVQAMTDNVLVIALQEFLCCRREAMHQTDGSLECGGCKKDQPAKKRCIECNDWLCTGCCELHCKVRPWSSYIWFYYTFQPRNYYFLQHNLCI